MKKGGKFLTWYLGMALFFLWAAPAMSRAECPASQNLSDYTAYPPFAADAVAPNILIVLDNSGSMNEQAYYSAYDETNAYYGYFNHLERYTYDQNIQAFRISDSGPWNGNFLNWLCMRRIDILRKVLVGGNSRGVLTGGPVTIFGEESQEPTLIPFNFGWDFRKEVHEADGLTPFTGEVDFMVSGGEIEARIPGPNPEYTIAVVKDPAREPDDFLRDPGDPANSSKARLAGVLQKIGNKARWGNMWFNVNSSYSSREEGAKLENPIGEITDELIESVQGKKCDTNTPLAESLFCGLHYYRQEVPEGFDQDDTVGAVAKGGERDPFYRDLQPVPCAPSYILMLTDGAPTDDTNIPDGMFADSNRNGFLDEIASWGKTEDMREDADLPGPQNIVFYAVFAFGNNPDERDDVARARALLQSAAMEGGYGDQDGNGVPDTYFEADDGEALEQQLMQAFLGMLDDAVSGTATSVVSSSSRGEGTVLQASFQPFWSENGGELRWPGFLKCLWIDADGTLDRLNPIWDAGERLKNRNASDRTIYTFMDKDGNNAVAAAGEFIEFSDDKAADLAPYLGIPADASWDFLGDTQKAQSLINYIRGVDLPGARSRAIAGGVWKLGDIVHSTPVTVSRPSNWYQVTYGDTDYGSFFNTYKNRETVVYVGANDGMLHAFSGGRLNPAAHGSDQEPRYLEVDGTPLGEELWAFIPQALLPHLKWLARPDYTHVYYVDQKPLVVDAQVELDGVLKWRTLLIGGLRYGGKTICAGEREFNPGYFCIDVTEPRNPRLLWERAYEGLGFSFSMPAVVRKNPAPPGAGEPKWFLVFGSGPTTYDGESAQDGHLFVVDLATGTPYKQESTADGDWLFETAANAFLTSPSAIDKDLHHGFEHETVYIGEAAGTIARNQDFKGSIYRLDLDGDGPSAWRLDRLFAVDKPITAGISLCRDYEENVWLFFGTGKFLYKSTGEDVTDDPRDLSTQYLIGLKDPYENQALEGTAVGLPLGIGNLYRSDGISVNTDQEVAVNGSALEGGWSVLNAEVGGRHGWYRTLSSDIPGERCITRPLVVGGALLVPTFVPETDICGFGGYTYLYGLYYKTGTAYYRRIFKEVDVEPDPHDPDADPVTLTDRIPLAEGMPPAEMGLFWGRDEVKAISQQSDTSDPVVTIELPLNMRSGLTSWREE